MASRLQPAGLPGVAPEPQQAEDPSRKDQQETTGPRPESGEAIVVGAIGSAAPWFLTGWAHEVEIEFMIDTGCHPPDAGVASTCYARSNGHLCIEPSWERGRPGLVPFVSDRPGAYGRLLLTVYVGWQTGLLVSSE